MSGSRRYNVLPALLFAGLLMSGCTSSAPPSAPAPAAGVTSELWGEMKPVVSVKELMRDLIDPLADNIFFSIASITDAKGTVDTIPRTAEDWDRIRIGGVAMAEGASLLKIRRPFAPAGDENNSSGPDAVELSPAAITAKVTADPVEWNARIEALRNVGLQVLDIVNRKATNELWDASENLDTACESCHLSYWYPGQTPEYWDRLDRRLKEFVSKQPPAARGK